MGLGHKTEIPAKTRGLWIRQPRKSATIMNNSPLRNVLGVREHKGCGALNRSRGDAQEVQMALKLPWGHPPKSLQELVRSEDPVRRWE